MSYIDIEILESCVRMFFVNIPVTDNVKTSISKPSVLSLSQTVNGDVRISLSDGRVWGVSCLPEYIQDTYPIRKVDGVDVSTNSDLYNALEAIF
jgi:hypothetical protein